MRVSDKMQVLKPSMESVFPLGSRTDWGEEGMELDEGGPIMAYVGAGTTIHNPVTTAIERGKGREKVTHEVFQWWLWGEEIEQLLVEF